MKKRQKQTSKKAEFAPKKHRTAIISRECIYSNGYFRRLFKIGCELRIVKGKKQDFELDSNEISEEFYDTLKFNKHTA